ncbi:hypothetical protein BH11PLA2_BH11PLA2_25800 [soil metagenome]
MLMATLFDEQELERWRDAAHSHGGATLLPPALFARLSDLKPVREPATSPMELPERIGEYRILSLRGHGGMGLVYEAIDEELNRRVAIKVLALGRDLDPRARERFRREGRAAASLQHENLVPVYATVIPETGSPFLIMPFIDGPTLAEWIARQRVVPPRLAAQIMRQIAGGVQALHGAGFLHRDIKPGNILLSNSEGGSPDLLVPKLTDFGLARAEEQTTMTSAEAIAGTPSYLSPEQIHSPAKVDTRADVYALGATLYECLTSVPPFRGTTLEVLKRIGDTEPVLPRALNRDIPWDLETICLKCLAKRPDKRYATAALLQADLDRYLARQPILARPAGVFERALSWVARNPWPTAAMILLLVGAVASGLGWARAASLTVLAEAATRNQALAREESVAAAAAATKSRQLAEQQAELALGTINSLVGQGQALAARYPNTLGLRKDLAELAMADLKKLAASMDSIEGIELTTLRVYMRVSELYMLMTRYPEARQQLDRGLERARELPAESLATADVKEQIGLMQHLRGVVATREMRPDVAIAAGTEAIQNLTEALALDPESYNLARKLAIAHNSRGDAYSFMQKPQPACDDHRAALAISEKLLSDHGGTTQLLRDLAFTEARLANVLTSGYDFTGAEAHSKAASQYADRSLTAAPANAETQRAARIASMDHCNTLNYRGDFAAVVKILSELQPVLDTAASGEPDNPFLQRDAAVGLSIRGSALTGLRRYDEAAASYERSLTIRETLGALAIPDRIQIGNLLANVETLRKQYDRAAKVCDRNLAILDLAEKSMGPNPAIQRERQRTKSQKRAYELMSAVIKKRELFNDQPQEIQLVLGQTLALHDVRNGDAELGFKMLERVRKIDDPTHQADIAGLFVHTIAAAGASDAAERDRYLAAAAEFANQAIAFDAGVRFGILQFPELLPLLQYPPFLKAQQPLKGLER